MKNWKKIIFWSGALFLAFCLGVYGATPENPQKVVTKTITKEAPVSKDWKELKSVDDRGFIACGEGFKAVSGFLNAQSRGDVEGMKNYNDKLESEVSVVQRVSSERVDILKKLGY